MMTYDSPVYDKPETVVFPDVASQNVAFCCELLWFGIDQIPLCLLGLYDCGCDGHFIGQSPSVESGRGDSSKSDKISYHEIKPSLEGARSVCQVPQKPIWNFAGIAG